MEIQLIVEWGGGGSMGHSLF